MKVYKYDATMLMRRKTKLYKLTVYDTSRHPDFYRLQYCHMVCF